MSLIKLSNLSFCYDGSYDMIFENVNLQLDTDWRLGLVGRNGRGKTTLLKLLCGEYEYGGSISGGVNFEYFPYGVADEEDFTLDVMRQIAPSCADWEICRELSLLAVAEDVLYRSFATLSGGEQTKVLLAALFLKSDGFLLIDEPTNHLDSRARQTVGEYLKRKKGFILVSHDRALLDTCVDHIIALNKTDIEVQQGNFSAWWQNKQWQDSFEIARNEKLQKEIRHLAAAAKRNAAWSDRVEKSKFGQKVSGIKPDKGHIGHKSVKMMKRSKVVEGRRQAALEEKSKLLHNVEQDEKLKISPLCHYSQRLVQLDGVSLFYGDRAVCKDISFTVNQGERLALTGRNGCGKSSILKLLCGEDISYRGQLYRAANLKISYVLQTTDHLRGSLSEYARGLGIDESIFKSILRKMDFARVQFEKDMADFSQGQKKKVMIAGSLCEQAHLYIWDEPLNFIDVISRMQIEDLLLKYQPTLLFVEHDMAFAENIATMSVDLG